MNETCETCKLCLNYEIADYSHGGCEHTKIKDEFICLAFGDEGLACIMRGIDRKSGKCECYIPKNKTI